MGVRARLDRRHLSDACNVRLFGDLLGREGLDFGVGFYEHQCAGASPFARDLHGSDVGATLGEKPCDGGNHSRSIHVAHNQ